MNNKSKIVIHPCLILILSVIRFSYIAGRRCSYEYSSVKLSEIELNATAGMNTRHSSNTHQRHQRKERDSNLGSSSAFTTEEVTEGLPNNMNIDGPQERGKSEDNVIKLILPKGEVEVSIKSRQGNESREAIELLVQSLKNAINRLGYSISLTTPDNMSMNRGTDAEGNRVSKGNLRTLADPGRKSVFQGARDLDLNDPDVTNDEENDIYDRMTTIESPYTEYEELYGYNHNHSLDSGSKPDGYAYHVDQDQDNDAGRYLSDYYGEEPRARMLLVCPEMIR